MGVVGTWIVKILGAMIWFGFGLLFWKLRSIVTEKKDYTQYPTAMGYIRTTSHFHDDGTRHIVEFVDPDGRQVWGMHDYLGEKDFPPLHTTQKIYYWKIENSSYTLCGRPVEYYIRYCDESLYEELDKSIGKYAKLFPVFGSLLFVVGILSLLS